MTELDDLIEDEFIDWFETKPYGEYSFRYEYFYGDTKIEDSKERQLIMLKWIKSAFQEGYNRASATFI